MRATFSLYTYRRTALGLPVFDPEVGHACELANVVGDESEATVECLTGDQNVVRSDRCSKTPKVCTNFAGFTGVLPVEVEHGEVEILDCKEAIGFSGTLVGAEVKLVEHDGGGPHLARCVAADGGADGLIPGWRRNPTYGTTTRYGAWFSCSGITLN